MHKFSLMRLFLASFLPWVVGCSAGISKPPAPIRSANPSAGITLSQFSVEINGAGDERAARGNRLRNDDNRPVIAADLNYGPLHIWIVAPTLQRAQAIYSVGRADGPCNLLVSSLLGDIANDQSFKRSWITYGVSMIRAAEVPQQQRLGELSEKVASIAAHPDCRGQIELHRLRADEIEVASEKMHKLAGKVFDSAKQVDRPILLWHNGVDGIPRFVPVAVGATKVPLAISLSLDELQIPSVLLKGLTLDGTTRQMGYLEMEVEHVEQVLDLLRPGKRYPKKIVYKGAQFNQAAIPEIRAKIIAARKNLEQAIEYEEQAVEATILLGNVPTDFANFADSLRRARAENVRMLERIDHKTSKSDEYEEIVYGDVEFAEIDSLRSMNAVKTLDKQRDKLHAEIEQLTRAEKKPITSPIPVLVDAFLRGWPASFDSRETNKVYDGWIKSQQEKTWQLIAEKLSRSGVSFTNPRSSLLLSNVAFNVRLSEDQRSVLIIPTYVMSSSGFQVADVAAGVVRYESASAEQNLMAP